MSWFKSQKIDTDPAKIDELLTRGVTEVIEHDRLRQQLLSGKQLRVKLGIDPTSPNIHIGRAVQLWKLRAFQELGHQVVLIIGDFTGIIGDTSDKESERPMFTEEQIRVNQKTYFEQAFKILDKSKTETAYNSTWLGKLGFAEIGKLTNLFSLHEFQARENIATRLKAGKRVSLRELMYPLMQGYDSVAVRADVELGGTDQRFNLLAGRVIQPAYNQTPQNIVMTVLMEGTDGRKMSSSWGNVINIYDEPNDMFGKVMSVRDDLLIKYFTLATTVAKKEIQQIEKELETVNPRDIKVRLAKEIVTLYHGKEAAEKAVENFENTFKKGGVPEDIKEIAVPKDTPLVDVLLQAGLVESKSDFRRLVGEGAVTVHGTEAKITDPNALVNESMTVKIGKRRFIKISVH